MVDEEKAVGGGAAISGPGLGDLLSEVPPTQGQGVSLSLF